jgi:pimeloyl-ACP methyl ester carboxylesterase
MEARALASDPARLRAEAPRLARTMFVTDYPIIKPTTQANGIYGGSAADPKAIQALKAAHNHLLPVPAFLSIVPGNVAPEAAAIDVPVFLAVGERDMTGPPNEIPAAFTASPQVELQVLAQAGHSHFLFASRVDLFDSLAAWARNLG